jgi:ankyrin repeat protein
MKKQPLFESSGMKKILLKRIEEIKREGKFKYYGLRFDAPLYNVGDVIKRNSKAGSREDMNVSGLCVYDINTKNRDVLDKIINTLKSTTSTAFFQGNTIYILGSDKRLSVEDTRKNMSKAEPDYLKKHPEQRDYQDFSKYLYDTFETRLVDPTVLAKINIQHPIEKTGDISELGFEIKQRANFSDDLLRFKKEDPYQDNQIKEDDEDDLDPNELTEEERREHYARFNLRHINPKNFVFDFGAYSLNKILQDLSYIYGIIRDGYYEDIDGTKIDTNVLTKKIEKCITYIEKFLLKGSYNKEKEKLLKEQIAKYLNSGDNRDLYWIWERGLDRDIIKYKKDSNLFKSTTSNYLLDTNDILRLGEIEKYDDLYYSLKIINAVEKGNKKEILKLLKAGVDVNIKDEDGYTALILASYNGHTETVKILLESGADVNIKDEDGYTALITASSQGHAETVKLLLESGADVNAENKESFTALMYASLNGHIGTVKLLLEAGADANVKNEYGETALDIAESRGHTETVKLLLEAGAEIDPNDTETMEFIVDHNLDYLVK